MEIGPEADNSVEIGSDSKLTKGANDVGQLRPSLANSHDPVHVLLSVSGLDHLGQDVSSGLVAGHFLLGRSELMLKLSYTLRLLQLYDSAEFFRFILPGDLSLLTPSLTAGLKEVGTGAFHGCSKSKKEVS